MKKDVDEMKQGADEYANDVLTQLQLLVTKLQKNLMRLEKNINAGRDMLSTTQSAYPTDKKERTLTDEKQ